MIIEEILEDNPDLVRRYSDQGYYIRNDQTGFEYEEAIDLIGKHTYTETDRPIPPAVEDSEAEEMREALHVLLNTN